MGKNTFQKSELSAATRLGKPEECSGSTFGYADRSERLVVGWRLGFDLASLCLGVMSVMAIDLATNPGVRTFLQELVKVGGNVPKEVDDFILNKPAFPVPIRMACALFTGTKVNLRNEQTHERDVLRDAYIISAIWRLLGKKIVEKRTSVETHLVLLNAVYVGAGQPLKQILDDRQTDPAAQRVAMPQTTLRGEQCTFEPEATL